MNKTGYQKHNKWNKTTASTIGTVLFAFAAVLFIPLWKISTGNLLSYGIELSLIVVSIVLINGGVLIHPCSLFAAYYVYIFALGPLSYSLRGSEYSYDAYLIMIGPLFLFAIGNIVGNSFSPNVSTRTTIDKTRFVIPFRRITLLYLILGVSFMLSMYYFTMNQSAFLTNLNSARIEAASGNGVIVYLMALPIVAMPMLLDLYLRSNIPKSEIPSRVTLIILTIVAAITLFASGFRSNVITMLVCMVIMYYGRKHITMTRLICYGLALVLVVTMLGIVRSGIDASVLDSLITECYVNGLNLQYIFMTFPDRVPFQYGYTYLINLFMLMPGPDLDFTLWLKNQIGLSFSGGGVTPTIVGELYLNFGYIGVILGMLVLGFLGSRLFSYYINSGINFLSVYLTGQFAHCVSGGVANVMIPVLLYGLVYKIISTTTTSSLPLIKNRVVRTTTDRLSEN